MVSLSNVIELGYKFLPTISCKFVHTSEIWLNLVPKVDLMDLVIYFEDLFQNYIIIIIIIIIIVTMSPCRSYSNDHFDFIAVQRSFPIFSMTTLIEFISIMSHQQTL